MSRFGLKRVFLPNGISCGKLIKIAARVRKTIRSNFFKGALILGHQVLLISYYHNPAARQNSKEERVASFFSKIKLLPTHYRVVYLFTSYRLFFADKCCQFWKNHLTNN